jgi:hypothetical protein
MPFSIEHDIKTNWVGGLFSWQQQQQQQQGAVTVVEIVGDFDQ